MHVHVGIEDDELRIDLMNQARYFLPHLLVLSTSSPFAEGEDTGLKCYRLAAYQELPRTGLPGRFEGWQEYQQTVDVLVRNGIIEDASKIWWDLRPSSRFPTLEMRVTDVCTRLEDATCVAAMFASILRMLYRIRRANQTWRTLSAVPARPRTAGGRSATASPARCSISARASWWPFRDLVDELLVLVREDAEALGCTAEIEHARAIVARGTSADRQVACFDRLVAEGASREEALKRLVDHLIAETVGESIPSPCLCRHGERVRVRGSHTLLVCVFAAPHPDPRVMAKPCSAWTRRAGMTGHSPADMPPSTASSAPVT